MTARVISLSVITLCSCVFNAGNSVIAQHSFQIYRDGQTTISVSGGGPKYHNELFTYEQVLILQQSPEEPRSLLVRPTGIMRSPDGRFFIADESRIVVFDKEGKYLQQIGRAGGGPSEFLRTVHLQKVSSTMVSTLDWVTRTLKEFDSSGQLIRTQRVQSRGRETPNQIYHLPDGRFIELYNGSHHQVYSYTWMSLIQPNGQVVASVQSDSIRTSRLVQVPPERMFPVPLPFAEIPMSFYISGKGILVSPGNVPELSWYNLDFELTHKHVIEGLDTQLTRSDRRQFNEHWGDLRYDEYHRDELRRDLGPDKPHWTFIFVDDAGFIWLRIPDHIHRWIPGKKTYRYRILSPEGEYLGDTATPLERHRTDSFTYPIPVSVQGGFLMTIIEDELTGEWQPIVYRITPNVVGLNYRK